MNANHKKIIENYVLAYNAFDIDGMTQNMHQDVVFENTTNGVVDLTTNGIAEFRAQAESAKQLFSKRCQTIQEWDFQTEAVTIQIHYEGVLAVDLPGGAMAGDTLELNGSSEFKFLEDQIIGIKDMS